MTPNTNPGQETIRVLVADNTRMHTQLLADALRRDRRLEVIGSSSHSRDLLDAITTHKMNVVVLASNLDEEPGRGLEVVRELHRSRPEIHTVVLLDSSKREAVVEAFRAGARGVFSRHESLETLSRCVRSVYEGEIWANSQQMLFAVEALAAVPTMRTADSAGLSSLSKRELNVVECLAEGLTNREIAERLGLSQHTIKNYLFRVFDKLGVSSRLELLYLTLSQPNSRLSEASAQSAISSPGNGGRTSFKAADLNAYHKAAEAGSPAAQFSLAEMYREGKSVAFDPVSAYTWYLVAEQTSSHMLEAIAVAKQQLAAALSPAQMKDAQQHALQRMTASPKAASPLSSRPAPARRSS
jgi:DNA-binding NarL/FixJ family response regulator